MISGAYYAGILGWSLHAGIHTILCTLKLNVEDYHKLFYTPAKL